VKTDAVQGNAWAGLHYILAEEGAEEAGEELLEFFEANAF